VRDARLLRAGKDRVPVGIERGIAQVAVRVD
jgi:hypothetical protein